MEESEVQALNLKRVLVQHGYEVITVRNGADGITMARTHMPSLIVTDIMMPVMNGYHMMKEIRNDPILKAIPVILLTQLTEVDEVINGLNCGAENYVTKPYDEEYLLNRIDALLENPCQFRDNTDTKATEFEHNGKRYSIKAGRGQTIGFLLSTYENAILKNKSLIKAQEELQLLNEQLEKKVAERTEALSAEIAERRQAEEALRESEERFRTIVSAASDAVICMERPGNIYLWNSKAEEIFGYTASEAIGKGLHDLIVPEKYREAVKEGLTSFFKTGAGNIVGKTVELTALRKDGHEFPVETSVAAVSLNGVWNSIGIIRDITERKRLEEEARQNLADAERMNRLMVGRELKMEELRQRAKDLEEKVKALRNSKGSE